MNIRTRTVSLREGREHTVVRVPVGGSRAFVVLIYGADPDCSETCVLDVVEVLPNCIPGSPTPSGMRSNSKQQGEKQSTKFGPGGCKWLGPHRQGARNGR